MPSSSNSPSSTSMPSPVRTPTSVQVNTSQLFKALSPLLNRLLCCTKAHILQVIDRLCSLTPRTPKQLSSPIETSAPSPSNPLSSARLHPPRSPISIRPSLPGKTRSNVWVKSSQRIPQNKRTVKIITFGGPRVHRPVRGRHRRHRRHRKHTHRGLPTPASSLYSSPRASPSLPRHEGLYHDLEDHG